ncbi:MAG: hypothetical protein ACREE5_06155 [Acetobacteraceae bacterium]
MKRGAVFGEAAGQIAGDAGVEDRVVAIGEYMDEEPPLGQNDFVGTRLLRRDEPF